MYCVEELHLSEDSASKRIQAARAARRFPALLSALAEGKLHLTAVCLLAPHLTEANSRELIEASTHRRKSEVEEMLARRFPLAEAPSAWIVKPIPAAPVQHALAHVDEAVSETVSSQEHAPAHGGEPSANISSPSERYRIQVTVGKDTHEKLRYAQALLSHAVPSGDLAQVLDRALDALILQLEKRKFGARAGRTVNGSGLRVRHTSARKRHVPAHVRRAVWERDQGRCTFVSVSGHRCNERRFLELDHVDPVARGGLATVGGMRLRCRAHNQLEAERLFGAAFMRRKREEARRGAAEARALRAEAEAQAEHAAAEERARIEAREQAQDVMAGLRGLGCRADEARRAVELTASLQGVTLEDRMRAALQFIGRRSMQGRAGGGVHRPG